MTIFTILPAALEFSQGMGLCIINRRRETCPSRQSCGRYIEQGAAGGCLRRPLFHWIMRFLLACLKSRQPLPLHPSFQELPTTPQTPCNVRCHLLMSDIPRKVQPTTRANKCASEFLIQKGGVDVCNSSVFKIHDSWEQPEPTHQEKSLLPPPYWGMQWSFFPYEWKSLW